jgi:response regulator RpfG family c-di-GMP phosphodiesterase
MNEVVDYIKEHRATQFDPKLVDLFLANLDEFIAISEIA